MYPAQTKKRSGNNPQRNRTNSPESSNEASPGITRIVRIRQTSRRKQSPRDPHTPQRATSPEDFVSISRDINCVGIPRGIHVLPVGIRNPPTPYLPTRPDQTRRTTESNPNYSPGCVPILGLCTFTRLVIIQKHWRRSRGITQPQG